ncbi:RdgB/HAM1 family non-canonical purine NTP pyrophosphatase [Corynebacterium sp. CCM 8862]|uniref:dITP/XTP pyrophosphatase n=1 Tax=Corynebacterium mendelii TaxID=2765362 RepID=A0A939IXJ9_9CORY|nr:RdgB/HAM1 family non-canonical purine NTP pyrophosphatase [Corynebacterium mendelii]
MLLHVASHNPKKLAELNRLLQAEGITGIELVSSEDLLGYPEPVEDGRTFADNALIKARAGAKATGITTLADDSGLAVDELGGMPGVLSARWCGRHGDDAKNNELLLAQMADVPVGRRGAEFVSVCAIVTPDGEEWLEKGVWRGRIVKKPVGDNGFGYDPLFIAQEEDDRTDGTDERPKTSAEMTPEEKDSLSHRHRALSALLPVLRELADRAEQQGTSITQEKASALAIDLAGIDDDTEDNTDPAPAGDGDSRDEKKKKKNRNK